MFAHFPLFHKLSPYFQLLVLEKLQTTYTTLSQCKDEVLYFRYVSVSCLLFSFFNFQFPFFVAWNLCPTSFANDQTFIDIACPPLWGSWKSLLDLYPSQQQTVVTVMAPYIADQWKHCQESFKKLCELFVGYHKTAMVGSYNKQMPQQISTFRLITKKRKEEPAEVPAIIAELSAAALDAANGVWTDQFGDSFLATWIQHFLGKKVFSLCLALSMSVLPLIPCT